ncbi:S1C family serine protease [Bifidobacterium breve]|uniref:S1C family serine protease n=1 Tax=Bifidobacterium breve TaxID=1685 RepID=UPI0022AF074F|nr:trypsin-like peptidase domain-containing protein [Bifidobacterium breve]MCZ4443110.1 trypsin-like peptidase domain-containing protein [Bifidobacterium breve]MCZ4446283.1 trypsin-like peptidase domain-containing protein [Bifidobacterium breve]MCZ4451875.1 trypsin-like peptidase domain-containing protein [Bifidobacterium breve]
MADEFNPQGVDQTPQNNDNPAPNGNETETQASAQTAAEGDAATTSSHEDSNPTQQMPSAQDDAPTAATEPIPNYAAAKGESTVVSSAPASTPAADTQSATPLYRPAPEFGAYGPTPTQPEQSASNTAQQGAQPTQQFPYGQAFSQQPQGQRNPYFTNNQQQGNSNPFNPQPQNNGNPFATPNGQRQGGLFGFGSGAGTPNGQNPQGPQGPAQPNRPGLSKTANAIVVAVVAALVAAALCLGLGYAAITNGWVTVPTSSSLSNVTSNKSGSGSATAKTGEAPDWQTVASGVSGSVVSIQTAMANGTAKGSGAIIDTEGHIITNNHVISGAQQIQVTLANGNIYSAQLVGADTTTDLAVIKLDNPPSGLKAVEFADSDKLAVGENVMAIGNPLGYDDTATTGIVSALNRPVTVTDDNNNEIVTNAVQIDAAINPGNSGGPTFNAAGQVIGINSSIASTATSSDSAGSIGIGFAIPSNLVKRVADEIIKDGSVKHVALGVVIKSDTVEADGVTRGGATITKSSATGSAVVSGGPADKAGLKEGDTIVAFNGNAVNNNYSLLGFVRAAALGDKATLTIVRDGKTMDVDVTLDQEESSVNGSSSSNSNGNNQNNQNGNGRNGYGNGNGNNDGGTGDGGGFSDPFGLW